LRITSNEYRNNKHKYVANTGNQVGGDNTNYSGYTDEDIVNFISELSFHIGCGYVIPYNICREYYFRKFGYNLPKSFSKFRFNGMGKSKLRELVFEMTKLPYNPYIMNNPKYGNVIRNKINELLKK
jgi:hypothetical protein